MYADLRNIRDVSESFHVCVFLSEDHRGMSMSVHISPMFALLVYWRVPKQNDDET